MYDECCGCSVFIKYCIGFFFNGCCCVGGGVYWFYFIGWICSWIGDKFVLWVLVIVYCIFVVFRVESVGVVLLLKSWSWIGLV